MTMDIIGNDAQFNKRITILEDLEIFGNIKNKTKDTSFDFSDEILFKIQGLEKLKITDTGITGSAQGLINIPAGELVGQLPAIDGSSLTNIVAAGSGVIVKDSGSTVGTAGTIDFGEGIDVSTLSAGIVTVTTSESSASGSFVDLTVSKGLTVGAASTFSGQINSNKGLDLVGGLSSDNLKLTGVTTCTNIFSSGIITASSFSGSGLPGGANGISFNDNVKTIYGADDDFEIYYSGSTSTIAGDSIDITNKAATARVASFTSGSATLFDSGVEKLSVNASGVVVSGAVTATTFVGDGSGLTNIVGTGGAVGGGITVKDSGSTVGTAGIIDFSTNLSVSAISAGIVTVTASGGGGGGGSLATSTGAFSATPGVESDLDTFSKSNRNVAEYSIFVNVSAGGSSRFQAQKALISFNDDLLFYNEYAIMNSIDLLVAVGATIDGSNIKLQATPQSGVTGVTTFKWTRQTLM